MKEVVVTAAGVLSPIGNSIDEFRKNFFEGVCGISEERGRSLPNDFPVPFYGKVKAFSAPPFLAKKAPIPSLGARAAGNVMEQIADSITSGLPVDAVISGYREPSELHLALEATRSAGLCVAGVQREVRERPLQVAVDFLKREKNILVPADRQIWMANACSTGNTTLGFALRKIRAGHWRRALVLNVEMDPNLVQTMGLFLLGALATTGTSGSVSRPFSRGRTGFVKADGAVAFLLEERSVAEGRGVEILGGLKGYAATTDAYRLTDGRPDAAGLANAMKKALFDSRLGIDEIDCISAHATSTPMGDELEAKAILDVFGDRAKDIPITALKSQVGHSTIAGGGLEALACLLMLKEQRIAPTLNLSKTESDFQLDFVVGEPRSISMKYVLSNSLGFGGQNSTLILQRPEQ